MRSARRYFIHFDWRHVLVNNITIGDKNKSGTDRKTVRERHKSKTETMKTMN
jgi:hypothetical protein